VTLRSALFLPIFDDLADPRVLVQLAVEAEDAGWDGVFLWDHIRWREPVRAAADPWIALTAMACATSRIRIGPMVTPLARRRPAKLARETASLDVLSGGRLTLGVGLGSAPGFRCGSRASAARSSRYAARLGIRATFPWVSTAQIKSPKLPLCSPNCVGKSGLTTATTTS
jgi:alkanesulfonate monooxygenase SsuD/methylene tetrahydromethanopterin reductase-like flavin-dependent oxidoreductase (luciferase family)